MIETILIINWPDERIKILDIQFNNSFPSSSKKENFERFFN